jgi:PAS domain S-box-containing protein
MGGIGMNEKINTLDRSRNVIEGIASKTESASSKRLFRAVIENSNDIIALMDESFSLIYRSPAATRVTGWTNEEMVGANATQNIYSEDKAYATAIVKEVMVSPGKKIETKFRMLHKNGHYFWVEGTFTNLLHDQSIKAIVFNFRNISRRVEAEEKLIASEKQFRHTLDNMLEGAQILDFDWRYIYVNEALAKSSKSTKESLIGNTLMKTYPGIEHTGLFTTLLRCMKERVTEHLETEIILRDGTKSDFELSIQPVPEGIFIVSIDITERKRIETQLIERKKQLGLFIEHSPASLAMFDKEMIYIVVSRRWISDYHLGDSQLIGKSHYDIFPEISQQLKDIHQRCLNGAIEKNEEDSFVLPDGSTIWLRWEARPWQKASGEIGGLIIFSEDISEKKLAEQEKEFDTNNLNALINNTNDMLWSVDRDYRLITSNKAFNNVIKSITGKLPVKAGNIFLKEFTDLQLKKYRAYYKRALAGETFTETEHDESMPDFWSEISFNPIYEGTTVIGTACHSRNISEKKKAEFQLKRSFDEKHELAERMSIILNTLPANIALLDGKGYIVDVNDSWRNFAAANGLTTNPDCIGMNYLDISKKAIGKEKEDGRKVARGIDAVLKKKIKEFVFEYPCHSQKTKRWFRMVVSPLLEREYAGAVVMHIDISELRKLEQERLKEKTEETRKITKAILTGEEKERNHIGQELHDNVNQILVGTKLYLTMAGNKNKEVAELIKYPLDLLDSSIKEIRLLCHKMVNPLNNVELEELIRGILHNLCQSSDIKTELIYTIPKGILSADLQLNIYRIIQELINNIAKYAGAQQAKISIKANKKNINIMVTDDGRGFDMTKKRNGIGISNMTNRVKSFNGSISIESSEGNGCETSITLPY